MPQLIDCLISGCILLPLSLAAKHFYETDKQTFTYFALYIVCSLAAYLFTAYLIPAIK